MSAEARITALLDESTQASHKASRLEAESLDAYAWGDALLGAWLHRKAEESLAHAEAILAAVRT